MSYTELMLVVMTLLCFMYMVVYGHEHAKLSDRANFFGHIVFLITLWSVFFGIWKVGGWISSAIVS